MTIEPQAGSSSDWQPPSPQLSPHCDTSNELFFTTPGPNPNNSSNFASNGTAISPTIINALNRSPFQPQPGIPQPLYASPQALRGIRSDMPPGQLSGGSPLTSQALFSSAASSVLVPGPPLSHSFLEKFDNTRLHDQASSSSQQPAATPANQMHTPPPTRDASSRKKSQQQQQQRLLPITTPTSIASRRLSAPGIHFGHGNEGGPSDASPFQFTPFQFSPGDDAVFNMGPLTAPVFPQANLFWDPNTGSDLTTKPFPAQLEDPFNTSIPGVGSSLFQDLDNTFLTTPTQRGLGSRQSAALQIDRPQSARPAAIPRLSVNTSLLASSPLIASAAVNPSMLMASQNQASAALPQSLQTFGSAASNRQPYQHQKDQLKREKDIERKRKETMQQPPSRTATVVTPVKGMLTLRRSLTDGRRRTGDFLPSQVAQALAGSIPPDSLYGRTQLHVPRESSPLKRHKSDLFESGSAWTPPPPSRRSVVLTVDEQGNARTEVKQVEERPAVTSDSSDVEKTSALHDDSDSSDFPESSPSKTMPTPARSDALNALKQAMKERRRPLPGDRSSQSSSSSRRVSQPLLKSDPPTVLSSQNHSTWAQDHSAWAGRPNHNFSTTTTTAAAADTNFFTPNSERTMFFASSTRCICSSNNYASGDLMIQCDTCNHWLHVGCLGLDASHLPPTFSCAYCIPPPANPSLQTSFFS